MQGYQLKDSFIVMKKKQFFLWSSVSMVAILLVGSLISSRAYSQSQSKRAPISASQPSFQGRQEFLDPSKPLNGSYRRLPTIIGMDIPMAAIHVPGDMVAVPLPRDLSREGLEARITKGTTTWNADISFVPKVIKTPTKSMNIAEWRSETPAIVVPQLPKGIYDIYYVNGSKSSPKTSISITPMFSVTGRDSTRVGNRVSFRAQIIGPIRPPVEIGASASTNFKIPSKFSKGGTTVTFQGFSDPDIASLELGQPNSVEFDDAGIATFYIRAHSIGETSGTFSVPGFRSNRVGIEVQERKIAAKKEDPNRPFTVLVLGDSIQWGQGLKTQNKMAEKVTTFLRSQLGQRRVILKRYAHSGGTIVPVEGQQAKDDDSPLPGEIPVFYPSVQTQLETATDENEGDTIDLVILDGGMNDVDIAKVLNPLNFTNDEIEDRADTFGRVAMQGVLDEMLSRYEFRKSSVLVTGYYPIVSSDSDKAKLSIMISLFLTAIWPDLSTKPIIFALGLSSTLAAQEKMARNCKALDESMDIALKSAVNHSNLKLLSSQRRVHFVSPDFKKENSLYASDPLVWQFGADDEVAGQRQADAIEYLLEAPAGPVASIGHPNVAGEQQYADKLISRLKSNREE